MLDVVKESFLYPYPTTNFVNLPPDLSYLIIDFSMKYLVFRQKSICVISDDNIWPV
jgi:hypothetical protein